MRLVTKPYQNFPWTALIHLNSKSKLVSAVAMTQYDQMLYYFMISVARQNIPRGKYREKYKLPHIFILLFQYNNITYPLYMSTYCIGYYTTISIVSSFIPFTQSIILPKLLKH